jgi:hypothetical protein
VHRLGVVARTRSRHETCRRSDEASQLLIGALVMSAPTAEAIQLQPLTLEHLTAVKTLNNVLFPIKYHVSTISIA